MLAWQGWMLLLTIIIYDFVYSIINHITIINQKGRKSRPIEVGEEWENFQEIKWRPNSPFPSDSPILPFSLYSGCTAASGHTRRLAQQDTPGPQSNVATAVTEQ